LILPGKAKNLLKSVYNNGVVVLESNCDLYRSLSKVWGCHNSKVIDFLDLIADNRYHKNTIIDKDILLLVGIDVLSLLELVLLIAGAMWSLYSRPNSSDLTSPLMIPCSNTMI
jgi:hypothetical protein